MSMFKPLRKAFVEELLHDALGYSSLRATVTVQVNERAYPVAFVAGHVPVVVAPFNVKLDDSLP